MTGLTSEVNTTDEKSIERYFTRKVKEHGGLAWKFVSPGHAGVPDRIVLLPGGKCCFAEIKAPGRKPRKLQTAVMKRLRQQGFDVWVIDSHEKVREFIAHYWGGSHHERTDF